MSENTDTATDSIERLAKRGNLTSDNHRDAIYPSKPGR